MSRDHGSVSLSNILRKKLREALYFFQQMSVVARRPAGDPEELMFLLSALLSAGRSITDALENRRHRAWFTAWQESRETLGAGLSNAELLEFLRVQRVAEVHRSGASVETRLQFVPFTEIQTTNRSHPAFGIHVFGGLDAEQRVEIGFHVHSVKLGGTPVEVAEACGQTVA